MVRAPRSGRCKAPGDVRRSLTEVKSEKPSVPAAGKKPKTSWPASKVVREPGGPMAAVRPLCSLSALLVGNPVELFGVSAAQLRSASVTWWESGSAQLPAGVSYLVAVQPSCSLLTFFCGTCPVQPCCQSHLMAVQPSCSLPALFGGTCLVQPSCRPHLVAVQPSCRRYFLSIWVSPAAGVICPGRRVFVQCYCPR